MNTWIGMVNSQIGIVNTWIGDREQAILPRRGQESWSVVVLRSPAVRGGPQQRTPAAFRQTRQML
jgi:hypothetical protein